eukprot:maker-scaffold_78-snap-gene-0.6-mRNA-1 protein AED:0.05 eAED:0.05 QI:248/1/1/1/1/1/3/466/337
MKPNSMSRKTSLEVFNLFVERDDTGNLLKENIFSELCFQKWLKTRIKPPQHPVGAFKRTIYAHLRAADGRSPFSKDVEESLLCKLRAVTESGRPIDPFAKVFGNRKKFRRNVAGGWHSEFRFPYGFHEVKRTKSSGQCTKVSRENYVLAKKYSNKLSCIENYLLLSKVQMTDYLQQAQEQSISFSFPAVAYLVELVSSTSYYFSSQFMLPPPEECCFRRDCIFLVLIILVPIVAITTEIKSGRILFSDCNFEGYFGNKSSLFLLSAGVIDFFSSRKLLTPVIMKQGFSWFRGTHIRGNKRYLLIGFVRMLSKDADQWFMQVDFDNEIKDPIFNKLLL